MATLGVLAALCIFDTYVQGVVVETYRLLPANGPLLLGSADPAQPRTSRVPAKIAMCLGAHVANRHAELSGDTAESARAVAWRKLFRVCSLHCPALVDREQWSSTEGKGARALFDTASGTLPCPLPITSSSTLRNPHTRTQPAAHLPIPTPCPHWRSLQGGSPTRPASCDAWQRLRHQERHDGAGVCLQSRPPSAPS